MVINHERKAKKTFGKEHTDTTEASTVDWLALWNQENASKIQKWRRLFNKKLMDIAMSDESVKSEATRNSQDAENLQYTSQWVRWNSRQRCEIVETSEKKVERSVKKEPMRRIASSLRGGVECMGVWVGETVVMTRHNNGVSGCKEHNDCRQRGLRGARGWVTDVIGKYEGGTAKKSAVDVKGNNWNQEMRRRKVAYKECCY